MNEQTSVQVPAAEDDEAARAYRRESINALSRFGLEVTAFTEKPSMSSMNELRVRSYTIPELYASLTSRSTMPIPFFANPAANPPYNTDLIVDFSCTGILFEFPYHGHDIYYTIAHATPAHASHPQAGVHRGFLRRECLGAYFLTEWLALPKTSYRLTGAGFSGAPGEPGGWWNVHDTQLQQLRMRITERAKVVHEHLLQREKDGKMALSETVRMNGLKDQLARVVDRFFVEGRAKAHMEAEREKAAESAVREFTVLCDEEEEGGERA